MTSVRIMSTKNALYKLTGFSMALVTIVSLRLSEINGLLFEACAVDRHLDAFLQSPISGGLGCSITPAFLRSRELDSVSDSQKIALGMCCREREREEALERRQHLALKYVFIVLGGAETL